MAPFEGLVLQEGLMKIVFWLISVSSRFVTGTVTIVAGWTFGDSGVIFRYCN